MPRRFKFNLEPLLRYRLHLEDERRRGLAQARQAVMEQNRHLMNLLSEENAGKNSLRETQQDGIDVRNLRLHQQYLLGLERRIREGYGGLQKRLGGEVRARAALAEARKRVRVLERLRERRKDRYDYELGRAEQKELDEVGLGMFHRREVEVSS